MSDQNQNTGDKQAGCGCGGAGGGSGHMMPEVTFSTFILSLSSSAMVMLGEVPDPETGQTAKNLPMAKHTIDVLAMLKDKTVRCLDTDEAKLIDGLLYELRMAYIRNS
ncbi:MAG: DUF1844 domain-containing protein [Desulfovibrionaceae bacterium]|jgi:hypothetical protein|nr:DUF1844 domain-containing protein [Desulfovibrionaceae bacterium]